MTGKRKSGFTLTEMMVSLTIFTLLTLAVFALFFLFHRGYYIVSLARNTSNDASTALERMVYGVSTNYGAREFYRGSVGVNQSGSGWTLVATNKGRLVRYQYYPNEQRIRDQNNFVICDNVVSSRVAWVGARTNAVSLSVTVRQTGGRRTTSSTMSTVVRFRNKR